MPHTEVPLADLAEIEARIDEGESQAILARWEMGKLLWTERQANGGKQLPHGRIEDVCEVTGKCPAEIRFRIQFYDRYRTTEEVSTAVATCKSWTAIRQTLSSEEPRDGPRATGAQNRTRWPVAEVAEVESADEAQSSWMIALEDVIESVQIEPLTDPSDETLARARALSKALLTSTQRRSSPRW